MNGTIPPALRGDYVQCAKIAQSHGENFPVASWFLPPDIRPHATALYAFARTADDFADEPLYEGNRLTELDRWERDFRLALKGHPSNSICRAFAYTVKSFDIPPELPLKLLTAFRMDVTVKRWKDWDSLLHYSRHSADPVGRCILYFTGLRETRLHLLSDKICTGLQLIDFLQDTAQDLAKGRIYYPKSEWKTAKLREKDFLAGIDTAQTRALVKTMVDKTEAVFREGFPLAREVPRRLRLELQATFAGGLTILRKIRRMDYGVFSKRVALNPWDKIRVGWTALFGSP
jgi:hydroxysqualene synthase